MILRMMHPRMMCLVVLLWACASEQGAPAKAAATVPGDATAPDTMAAPPAADDGDFSLKKLDLNRDGKPDIFKYYREVRIADGKTMQELVRKEIDINHDSKIDVVRYYQGGDQITQERIDLDFDGQVDEISQFEQGIIFRKRIDINYDGRPDVYKFYLNGKLEHIESDRDFDGKIDTWEYYEDGVLDRVGADTNGDGEADQWQRKTPGGANADTGSDTTDQVPVEEESEVPAEAEPTAPQPPG